jgi:hypothetical protein
MVIMLIGNNKEIRGMTKRAPLRGFTEAGAAILGPSHERRPLGACTTGKVGLKFSVSGNETQERTGRV